ncbi:hypothetical protein QE152_g19668 [Popillia japonica]|uniref:Uncharacterized protein n=1 Tax=Popillia japonica TaxID=7064 RepID=A0AAW1KPT9_POPJA
MDLPKRQGQECPYIKTVAAFILAQLCFCCSRLSESEREEMWFQYSVALSGLLILANGGLIISPNVGNIPGVSHITRLPSDDNVVTQQENPAGTPQFTVLAFAGPVRRYTTKIISASGYPPATAGSGVEGRYIADNREKLFDDGSYKPDYSEKLYDDGSYKGEKIYWYKGKRIYW